MLDSYKPNSKLWNYDLGLTTDSQLQDLNEEKHREIRLVTLSNYNDDEDKNIKRFAEEI